jgi:creatinine amidohydrolase/Fe(II)-dependent formamide hydrolase-like protein
MMAKYHNDCSKFRYVDLFGTGPINIVEWTSTYTESGTCGEATKATLEKGHIVFEEAVRQLVSFSNEFQKRPIRPRQDHHLKPPIGPVPG